MNKPAYMHTDWFQGLLREIANSSVTAVAARMGLKRVTLSIFIHGKGTYGSGRAKPDKNELRYRQAFEQLDCPHTGKQVDTAHCRQTACRTAPTHNPLRMAQWQSCQGCTWKPVAIVKQPVQPDQVQQAGIIDRVTLPLLEVGAPQVQLDEDVIR